MNKSEDEIKTQIEKKKSDDKNKVQRLTKIAIIALILRFLIYLLPFELGGLLIEILWIPLILLLFSLPFYGFEKLLDKYKK